MLSPDAKSCIETCLKCYTTCLGRASNHCLKVGGPHVEQEHFRLMLACAEVCRTHAHLTLLGSPHAKHLAPKCAEIATKCADSCEKVGDMDDCVAAWPRLRSFLRRDGLTGRTGPVLSPNFRHLFEGEAERIRVRQR